jgi:geranylgeranyl pyrophosphate synthase
MHPSSAVRMATGGILSLVERELSEPSLSLLLDLPEEQVPRRLWESALLEPARTFLSRPGKHFRAQVVDACFRLAGGSDGPCPMEALAAVELLHAGSLIVDDIEDASEERRGAPALHARVGVPLALNTGNLFYFLPLVLLERLALPPHRALLLQRVVSRTLVKCHHGQALDLSVRVGVLPQGDMMGVVNATTRLKTASLFELAAHVGAAAAGADEDRAAWLARFAHKLGMGLQMLDDLSGIDNPARARKGHEDLGQERPTWPWAWAAHDLEAPAFGRLQRMARRVGAGEDHPELLAEAMRQALGGSGRTRVHAHLDAAFDGAIGQFGPSAVLQTMREDVAHLEAAYG